MAVKLRIFCSGQVLLWCMQVEGKLKAGAPIKVRILDVSKKDGVVDLSLRPVHTAAGVKKAAKALAAIEASSHQSPLTPYKASLSHNLVCAWPH